MQWVCGYLHHLKIELLDFKLWLSLSFVCHDSYAVIEDSFSGIFVEHVSAFIVVVLCKALYQLSIVVSCLCYVEIYGNLDFQDLGPLVGSKGGCSNICFTENIARRRILWPDYGLWVLKYLVSAYGSALNL